MEHLNRLANDAIQNLGANKSEEAIKRVGRSIGTLSPVLDQFDTENSVSLGSGRHTKPSICRDIAVAVKNSYSHRHS